MKNINKEYNVLIKVTDHSTTGSFDLPITVKAKNKKEAREKTKKNLLQYVEFNIGE